MKLFFRTLELWIIYHLSLIAGIDDFSCGENWNCKKSAWSNCKNIATSWIKKDFNNRQGNK